MSDDSARRGFLSVTPPIEPLTVDEGTQALTSGPAGVAGHGVPRFRILGVVGVGGMGVVYRAEDTRLGRTVALKFLPPMLIPNPRAKARFMDEARAASALDHPNLCTIYEVGETAEGQLYLAMALYEGETVKQRLERGPLAVEEALEIAAQVARGLAKAHRHGIVHRDIKPANLMLTTDGIVKILDFGIARLPDQTQAVPFLGTPGYMSPEQARGRAVDAPSDVWSLGIVLLEMLTGSRQIPGGLEGTRTMTGEVPPARLVPAGAPPGTTGLLARMLAEAPEDRYPDAGALLADLSVLERAALDKAERAPGRRRWLQAGALTLAALGLAACAWLLWDLGWRDEAPDPRDAKLTQLTDLPGKEWYPSITPDGKTIVYARNIGGRSRLYQQRVGGDPRALLPESLADDSQPAISPDGQLIAFRRSDRDGEGIFVMGLTGESVRRVTNAGFNPAWSPDGKEIVYATEGISNPLIRRLPRSEIYRVNLAGPRSQRITSEDAVQPSWSPRGLRIAYWGISSSGQRVISTLPADGRGPAVPVTDGSSVDWNPVWSPDGRYLYFVSDRTGMPNLWRVPIDERSGRTRGEPEFVTRSDKVNMLLSISRDGKNIAYASDGSRTSLEKLAFDPQSGKVAGPGVTLTETSHMIPTLDASRDGRWLVYQTFVPHEELFVLGSDGTEGRLLLSGKFRDRQPRWSPDGKRIAFYSNRQGKYDLWMVNADGSRLEPMKLVPDRPAKHPIWSPDGRSIVCDLEENAAFVDLSQPSDARHARLLPRAPGGLGFSASSWSADGRWLAGALHKSDGSQLPGIFLYSREDRQYSQVATLGNGATWLSDSRHLLYWEVESDRLMLLDIQKGTSRLVLTAPQGSRYDDLSVSPDDRFLYLARSTEESDIWLLTMK